jgi:hypothetical protein
MKLLSRCFMAATIGLVLLTTGCGSYGSPNVYIGVAVPGPYIGYPYYGPHSGWVGRPYPAPYWRDRDDLSPEPYHDSIAATDSTAGAEPEGG